jgi:LmbE family N-acetylglucosaminyl deacetylase
LPTGGSILVLRIAFPASGRAPRRILFLGAHSDDIEIGCGGTILRLLSEWKNLEIYWIVFGAQAKRADEAVKSAQLLLGERTRKTIVSKGFRDGFFPYIGAEIKDAFEELKVAFDPDVIFTHYRYDLHQDHRLICELTWNTFRNHLIFEYEVIKYDGDLGTPNLYVPLAQAICQKKVTHIRKCFKTQGHRAWFTDDTFYSLLRLRGVESQAPSHFAEAFYCRKMVF